MAKQYVIHKVGYFFQYECKICKQRQYVVISDRRRCVRMAEEHVKAHLEQQGADHGEAETV